MKNIAVVLAGGVGKRYGSHRPKQLEKVAGKTILEHTIEVFQASKFIDEIVVVIKSDYVGTVEEMVLKNHYNRVKKVLAGGAERSDSSLSAINSLSQEQGSDEYNVLFHDAVRPFVSDAIIERCIESLTHYRAVDTAIPTADTIIKVSDGVIKDIPLRKELKRGQTPQAFKLGTIRKAYDIAKQDPDFLVTDDCGVVLKYLPEEPVAVVEGDPENIKITNAQDIFLADKIFQMGSQEQNHKHTQDFYREKLQGKTVIIIGASYGIGKEIADFCESQGANVFRFSRSETNTNIENMSDIQSALSRAHDETGSVDFVINTAAVLHKEPLLHMSHEAILNSMNINYLGSVYLAKASLPYLEKSCGQLLFFTSSSYTRGRANYSLYSSTKAAVVNLTQALAEEWAHLGVRVNCINPERTATPMRTKSFGIEDKSTLLDAKDVALVSVNTLAAEFSGQVISVKL